MSEIIITQAEIVDAENLRDLSVDAFIGNFERYGHYPPGLESLDWHQDKVKNGIYYKILYAGNVIGGVTLIKENQYDMEIEYLFIGQAYQDKKFGSALLGLLEKEHAEVKKWMLFTPYKDFRNHHFYEKNNYIKTGEASPVENSDFKLFKYEKLIKAE